MGGQRFCEAFRALSSSGLTGRGGRLLLLHILDGRHVLSREEGDHVGRGDSLHWQGPSQTRRPAHLSLEERLQARGGGRGLLRALHP